MCSEITAGDQKTIVMADLSTAMDGIAEAQKHLAFLRAAGCVLPPFGYLAVARRQLGLILEALEALDLGKPSTETYQIELPF